MKSTLAAAAAACLLLAGCGSDDSAKDGGDRGTTLTKAQFIVQGDAICQTTSDQIEAALATLPGEPAKEQMLAFVTDTVIPQITAEVKALRSLPSPDEGADEITAMLDSIEAEVARAKADPEYALSEEAGFAEADRIARDYGFKECGSADE